MPELKKYMFDNFVVEAAGKEEAEAPAVVETTPEVVEEPSSIETLQPVKTYTEDETDDMVHQAQEEGYENGFKAAIEGIEAENTLLLTAIKNKLENIINDSCVIKTRLEKQFADMGKLLIQKVIPPLQDEYADKIIADFIKDNFANIKDESKLAFYLNPNSIEVAQEVIEDVAHRFDFEGKIAIHKDDSLARSEARIEWDEGGIECKADDLIGKVTGLLDDK